jgi:hypothetical protein
MIVETDQRGRQQFAANVGKPDDQQLYEMMRVGGGMVYRNQRILQIKECEAESNSYYMGPTQARADMENDYRKKIRGYAIEVSQRAQNREKFELGFLMDKLKREDANPKPDFSLLQDMIKGPKDEFARQ